MCSLFCYFISSRHVRPTFHCLWKLELGNLRINPDAFSIRHFHNILVDPVLFPCASSNTDNVVTLMPKQTYQWQVIYTTFSGTACRFSNHAGLLALPLKSQWKPSWSPNSRILHSCRTSTTWLMLGSENTLNSSPKSWNPCFSSIWVPRKISTVKQPPRFPCANRMPYGLFSEKVLL